MFSYNFLVVFQRGYFLEQLSPLPPQKNKKRSNIYAKKCFEQNVSLENLKVKQISRLMLLLSIFQKNIFGTHCSNFSKARPQNKKEFFDVSSF